jgi:hypothetical protein
MFTALSSMIVRARCAQLESDHHMNSSEKSSHQILGMISKVKAQKLLEEWANINPAALPNGAMKRLVRQHPEAFLGVNPQVLDEQFPPRNADVPQEWRDRQKFVMNLVSLIATIAVLLREGWSASDPRRREWCFIRTRWAYHVEMERLNDIIQELTMGRSEVREVRDGVAQPKRSTPPIIVDSRENMHFAFLTGLLLLPQVPLTPFEAAMFYLQTKLIDKLRLCPNPRCPAPYFFATKKGQKFCSTVCAEPAQRESKRKWWNENRGVKKRSPETS